MCGCGVHKVGCWSSGCVDITIERDVVEFTRWTNDVWHTSIAWRTLLWWKLVCTRLHATCCILWQAGRPAFRLIQGFVRCVKRHKYVYSLYSLGDKGCREPKSLWSMQISSDWGSTFAQQHSLLTRPRCRQDYRIVVEYFSSNREYFAIRPCWYPNIVWVVRTWPNQRRICEHESCHMQ